jgi:hypothetical protein
VTHQHAEKELAAGTPAELICATCPWDRLCVEPPNMSELDIKRQLNDAEQMDLKQDPDKSKMPMATLMTALIFAGKDKTGKLCPVFALRLRGPDGRQCADAIRQTMRTWGEPS